MAAHFLSDDDVQKVQQLWRERNQRVRNTQQRPAPEQDWHQAPECYVAKTSSSGIPALEDHGTHPSGTGTGTGVEPGVSFCNIYKVDFNSTHSPRLHVVGFDLPIYNLSGFNISGDVWILVNRDKWGQWWVSGGGDDAESELPKHATIINGVTVLGRYQAVMRIEEGDPGPEDWSIGNSCWLFPLNQYRLLQGQTYPVTKWNSNTFLGLLQGGTRGDCCVGTGTETTIDDPPDTGCCGPSYVYPDKMCARYSYVSGSAQCLDGMTVCLSYERNGGLNTPTICPGSGIGDWWTGTFTYQWCNGLVIVPGVCTNGGTVIQPFQASMRVWFNCVFCPLDGSYYWVYSHTQGDASTGLGTPASCGNLAMQRITPTCGTPFSAVFTLVFTQGDYQSCCALASPTFTTTTYTVTLTPATSCSDCIEESSGTGIPGTCVSTFCNPDGVPASFDGTFTVTSGSCSPSPDGQTAEVSLTGYNGGDPVWTASGENLVGHSWAMYALCHNINGIVGAGAWQVFLTVDVSGVQQDYVGSVVHTSGNVWTVHVAGISVGGCMIEFNASFDTTGC